MFRVHVFALTVLCVLMTTAGQIALKAGVSTPTLAGLLSSGNTTAFFVRAAMTPLVLAGLMLYGAGAVLWLLVLARADLSYAYPLISLGFVVAAVFAHFVMGETLSTARIVGILLICGGVVAIARS
jgi:drug/metabolite transporter (DMT)-like permease